MGCTHLFIINPTAGRRSAAPELQKRIEAAGRALGVECRTVFTKQAGHAVQLAAQAAAAAPGRLRVYACGGDGTLNEVLRGVQAAGLPAQAVPVGHVPCGSGNDTIRNWGDAAAFCDLAAMMQGEPCVVDLLQVNGQAAISICAAGLDAKVASRIPAFRRLPLCGGSMAYTLSVACTLLGRLGYDMTVETDAGDFSGCYLLAAIGNGSWYGGGYHSLPFAKMDDGLLDVILVDKIPLLRIAPLLARYKAGTHFTTQGAIAPDLADMMTSLRATRVKVCSRQPFYYTADGECTQTTHMEVQVLPQAAAFILPKGLHEKD